MDGGAGFPWRGLKKLHAEVPSPATITATSTATRALRLLDTRFTVVVGPLAPDHEQSDECRDERGDATDS